MTSNKDFVFGRHAGLDYLKTQSADKINKVFLQHGVQEEFANQVYSLAKKKRLVVQDVPKNKLDRLVAGGNHQGLVLAISSFEYADLDQLLDKYDAEGKAISKTLDIFNDEINVFLTKLSAKSLSARSLRIIHNISTAVEEINQIGDRSVKLIKTKIKMNDKHIIFSADASKELNNIIKLVEDFCHQVEKLYVSGDKLKEITDLAENEERIDQIRKTYKKNHLKRLDAGVCSLPAGLAFIDLLNTLEKIADNTYAIALLIADENL